MGKISQKQRKHNKCGKQIIEKSDDDQPCCWICYEKLTKKNLEPLQCGHNNYCKNCLDKWANTHNNAWPVCGTATKNNKRQMIAMTFFDDMMSFPCPTCKAKHTYVWPSFDGKDTAIYPKQIIAYLRFSDRLDRNPASYITGKGDLLAHVPKQFKHTIQKKNNHHRSGLDTNHKGDREAN